MKGTVNFFIFILLLKNCVCLRMYALQVRIFSYENKDSVLLRGDQKVCCDGAANSNPCEPCDTLFLYCLRFRNPNRISSLECPNDGRTLMSEVNTDDGPLDFSMSTVLGLPNPLVLTGFQDPESFELLIVALDSDSSNTFELIDAFIIPLGELRQGQTEVFDQIGNKNIIQLDLELTLRCVNGYTGELCDREEEPVTTVATMTESPPTTVATTAESPPTTETTTELLTTMTVTTGPPTPVLTTEPSTTATVTIEPPITTAVTATMEPPITTAVIATMEPHVTVTTDSPTITSMTTKKPTKPATTNTIKVTTKPTMDHATKTTPSPLNKDPSTLSITNKTTASPTLPEDCTDTNCSGHGVCVFNESNISCVCQPGFTGPNCTVETVSERRKDNMRDIIGGTVGSLTVIIIIGLILGVAIALVLRQKHRKQQVNERDANIEQHLPPLIMANENHDYGMIKNIIYGMQLDTGQQEHEVVENIYDSCDQVREESHLYESADHFQMNFNIVYQENEDNYYY